MKAACLLLCLALAHQTTGHMIRRYQRYNPQVKTSYRQNQEYVSPQWNQAVDNEAKQYPMHYETHYYGDSQSNSQEHYQPNVNQDYKRQEVVPQSSQETDKHQKQQARMYQTSQSSYYNQKQPREEENNYMKINKNIYDSSYNQEHVKEAEPFKELRFAAPLFADLPLIKSHSIKSKTKAPVSGDPVAWRGLRIAAGPKNAVKKQDIENIFDDAYNTMSHLNEKDKVTFHQALEEAITSGNEDVHLNATQLLNKYQYDVETHTVKTDDGYSLTLFHIPARQQTPQRPVVFLMHGLLGSADDWLLMGPGKSLAYLLADAGYDVWLGNARGSKYSRQHVTKHPAMDDFWQFSIDEIALLDLPVMIDYVLQTSNQERMYYVGHSQGTTAFFALASSRPEYNDKIIMMYALSPMVYMSHVRSPMLRMIASKSRFDEQVNKLLGYGEFKPSLELIQTLGGAMLEQEIGCKKVASNVNFVMSGVNVEDMDVQLIPVIMGHLPAGASTRQINQYAQAVGSHEFTKYDHGPVINEKVYGSSVPPKYMIQNVQVPVSLYYSEDDWMAHPMDVARLEQELPNVKDSYKVPTPRFTSMDFQFSKQAPEVYKRLIENIQMQNQ